MRERNFKTNVFLNKEENDVFNDKAIKSGLSKSEFFRKIILDYELSEKPDPKFYEILIQLRGMANNLNQIARTYNRYNGMLNEENFTSLSNKITDFILSLEDVYITPKKKGK